MNFVLLLSVTGAPERHNSDFSLRYWGKQFNADDDVIEYVSEARYYTILYFMIRLAHTSGHQYQAVSKESEMCVSPCALKLRCQDGMLNANHIQKSIL